ncbi:MAG: hypothetical protein C4B59_08380 [Candidatus Methanogaster sp.]|uniref:Uncharacterized protein n=1 Tax=Candidatus Methanogaster sp. TaxID=3386292 RepID=A0AC61L370_9EURY|nr:MAG: hypothetical protein C4B59_08380 [ANME-2 cluster archaeon]
MTIRTGKSYDFSIHTAPECSDTPEAMAEIASGYGYAGLAITNHTPHQLQKPQKQGMTDYAGIAVYQGIEIVAKNPHHLRQMIQKHRAKVRVLSVHGGNEKINHTDIFSNRIFSDHAEANSSTNLCKGWHDFAIWYHHARGMHPLFFLLTGGRYGDRYD